MKIQNSWETYFEEWLDLTEFTLIKHNDGWGLCDRQGANLGNIEADRFENAADIFDRMDVYVNDYIFEDLDDELEAYDVDMKEREIPWSAEGWLELKNDNEFATKNKRYFDSHKWEFGLLDTMVNHVNEINLENVYYESEEK